MREYERNAAFSLIQEGICVPDESAFRPATAKSEPVDDHELISKEPDETDDALTLDLVQSIRCQIKDNGGFDKTIFVF